MSLWSAITSFFKRMTSAGTSTMAAGSSYKQDTSTQWTPTKSMLPLIGGLVLAGTLFSISPVKAQTTYTAATCNQADVAGKVNLTVNGDTVLIPNGTCIWTSQLNVSTGITIQGQNPCVTGTVNGISNLPTSCPTTIIDNVDKTTGSPNLIQFSIPGTTNSFGLNNLEIQSQAADVNHGNNGTIRVFGTSVSTNVHHLLITYQQIVQYSSFFRIGSMQPVANDCVYGVFHHNNIPGSPITPFMNVNHDGCGGSFFGDYNWAQPLTISTAFGVFLEDNNFVNAYTPSIAQFTDGQAGLIIYIRHNYLRDTNTTAHGADSGHRARSVRWQDINNNTFQTTNGGAGGYGFVAWFRGGTGVMYSNTIITAGNDSVNNVGYYKNCRDDDGCANIPAGDTVASWAPWGGVTGGVGHGGYCNGTSLYDTNTMVGRTGPMCVDQPGAGTSVNLNGIGDLAGDIPPTYQGPMNNSSDPIYVWNNTVNGVSNNTGSFGGSDAGNVHVNRDIFFGTARPSYVEPTYPHPLQGGSPVEATPNPPTGLTISRVQR